MTLPSPTLLWFRNDLRLADNPALCRAAETGAPVIALYVLENAAGGRAPVGDAARWWLSRSLQSLGRDLEARGVQLVLRSGDARTIVPDLAHCLGAGLVAWNRRYDPVGIACDSAIKADLKATGVAVDTFGGSLLREPWEVKTQAGDPMRVFTPFWRAHQRLGEPGASLPVPAVLVGSRTPVPSEELASWGLEPTSPNWAAGFAEVWSPGEAGARARLADFLDAGLARYPDERNRPDLASTSRLSPHLRFGELSPVQIWHASEHAGAASGRAGIDKFLSEVGWREFSYHLLFHWPRLAQDNFQARFDAFPWRTDPAGLAAWQRGLTGYPLVDAGMRELWQTGWMHNRVRMVVASFLIKHLMIDWREGEAWFWETLVDADAANNAASWQWVAGSGADAAPYFRVFNPVKQGETFDPKGDYIRRYVPELARLPDSAIHAPWQADDQVLKGAGVRLGVTYPRPIVDHAVARARALDAFQALRGRDDV
ncbi:deoxyribodipyrimidine photo-lyase [Phreatobacter aquaticus]|uniref:Deoxyribodipyrimidine photo-lyase n=1 Tax=Phreatobacter aquaticus TaxID=2570229 RepID=A0A4D7QJH7_9HYPH|nr:deoxyribodipyrimidine photo-lyase [Phreatobacter aquaticus]QCK87235.1 deoxyribodipyrimidine photo-lyase [Phreatobacter aquaticus]